MDKVLHFRNTFLRSSETFVARVIHNHQRYKPFALGIKSDDYLEGLDYDIFSGSKLDLAKAGLEFFLGKSPSYINEVVQRERPSLIHAHFGQDGYIMVPTAKQNKLALVVSFYGKDVTQLPMQSIWRRRYKSIIEGSTLVVAASNKMKRQLIDLGFAEDKIRVVRFGVDMKKFDWRPKDKDERKIMLIGRFVEKKGMEYAVQAISLLKDKYPDIKLDIYGEGEMGPILEELINGLELGNHVSISGFVPNNEVSGLMQNYDVLLVPSVTAANNDQEGLPNVIIEGMASGVCLVASDHAAIPEIVLNGNTGFISQEKNPSSIAEGVSKIFDDPDLKKQILKNASEFVRREHDLKKTVGDLELVYDEAREIVKKS